MSNFYNLKAKTISGQDFDFNNLKGKVLLIVNTASKCGLTPQYEGLESLYQKYKGNNLVILGFPCNQFGHQEPGTEQEIASNCLVNYGVTFQMFSKIDVNGKNTHPVFSYLKSKTGIPFFNQIKWNFTKFLISKEGKVLKRFSPITKPEAIDGYLIKNNLL